MHIDKYKDKDQHEEENYYTDKNGYAWDGQQDFLQGGILGFCCCGIPNQNLKYVGKALRLLSNLSNQLISYEEFNEQQLSLFGSREGAYFMWYFLSSKDLTEHGGSVPGWLSKEGIELMEDIESLEDEED